jgi:RNA methyltransferase, TrmH family
MADKRPPKSKYTTPSKAFLERRAKGVRAGNPGHGLSGQQAEQPSAAKPQPKSQSKPQPPVQIGQEPLPSGFITSPENDKAKFIRTLQEKKNRYAAKHFLAEGIKLVNEAWNAAKEPLFTLFEPEALRQTESGRGFLLRLNDLIEEKKPIYPTTAKIIASLADTVTPQGIVAAVPFLTWDQAQIKRKTFHLILDGLQDPGNLGTLLRTAGAAGNVAVWLTEQSVDLYSPKVVRAGMGAHFRVPAMIDQKWENLSEKLAALGVTQVLVAEGAISEEGESKANYRALPSVSYDKVDWTQPTAVIIGNEAHGASREAWNAAQRIIAVPMPGGMESLNAAIAGSIIIYEALRQTK